MSNPNIIEYQEKIGIGIVPIAGLVKMLSDVDALSADWFYSWAPKLPTNDVAGWYVGSGASTISGGLGHALLLTGADGWAVQTVKVSAGSTATVSFDANLLAGPPGGVAIEYRDAGGKVVSSSFAEVRAGANHYSISSVAAFDAVEARIVAYAAAAGKIEIDNLSLTQDSSNQLTNGDFETMQFLLGDTEGFVPMIWNAAQMKDLPAVASARPGEALLTFNEPDNKAQANMTVGAAISYWPVLMESGMRLGSPAVTFDNTLGATSWLGQFMSAVDANNYRVDFIAVHYYTKDPSVEKFSEFLNSVHTAYGRPVWVTEWSLADWDRPDRFTADQQMTFFTAATQMMDDLPFVERHAWYSAYEGLDSYYLNSGLVETDGSFSAIGLSFQNMAADTGSDIRAIGLVARKGTVDGSAVQADVLTGSNGANSFYFKSDVTGNDIITNFGKDDVLALDKALYDGNSDGIIAFSRNVLSLDAPNVGDMLTMNGVSALRYLGIDDAGHLIYADASVRPKGAKESTLSDDVFIGDTGDKRTNVFFFDTALGADLGDDAISKFGKRDVIATTSKIEDSDSDGRISGANGLFQLPNGHGSVMLKGMTGAAVNAIEFDGTVVRNDVSYYVYSLVGSTGTDAGDLIF